jgi:cytochrome c peroxidase
MRLRVLFLLIILPCGGLLVFGAGFTFQSPQGIPQSLWQKRIPADNPMTAEKVALGEMLYFDKRLSASGSVSCAVCHDPANAFTDHETLSTGTSGNTGTRNAPTILNAMFSEQLFWDGRAGSLEEQAKQPLTNPLEMGMGSYDVVVERVSSIAEYQKEFRRVFGKEGITIETIVKAIAAYERTQLSGNSPFDRFIAGEQDAITESQKRGWQLFNGKAGCIECHSFSKDSPFFTDFKFHNTGLGFSNSSFEVLLGRAKEIDVKTSPALLAHKPQFAELGRFLVTKQASDIAAFKTPTLRDVELTTPYMHNGALKTLLEVVRFYNQGGEKNPNLDQKLHPLGLTDAETNELVEFLRALTGNSVLKRAQLSTPQTRSTLQR